MSGPVVIGGPYTSAKHESLVKLLRSLRRNNVKDSKSLSAKDRGEVLQKLKMPLLPYRHIGRMWWKDIEVSFVTWNMDQDIIDKENIFQANIRGMKEAAEIPCVGDKLATTVLL